MDKWLHYTLPLLVQFACGLVAVIKLGEEPGALSELSCEHTVDPLLDLLLSPQNLEEDRKTQKIWSWNDYINDSVSTGNVWSLWIWLEENKHQWHHLGISNGKSEQSLELKSIYYFWQVANFLSNSGRNTAMNATKHKPRADCRAESSAVMPETFSAPPPSLSPSSSSHNPPPSSPL